MKELTKYDIDIYGLPQKQHVYEFESGHAFFNEMQQEIITNGHFAAHLTLDKSATLIQLAFRIKGTVELTCDRTLALFDEHFDIEKRLILKFGDYNEELSEDIELINRNTPRINVARYIYEFIVLSLPVKKLHPSERTSDGNELETLVYTSHPAEIADSEADNPGTSTIDPRWEALKKLKKE